MSCEEIVVHVVPGIREPVYSGSCFFQILTCRTLSSRSKSRWNGKALQKVSGEIRFSRDSREIVSATSWSLDPNRSDSSSSSSSSSDPSSSSSLPPFSPFRASVWPLDPIDGLEQDEEVDAGVYVTATLWPDVNSLSILDLSGDREELRRGDDFKEGSTSTLSDFSIIRCFLRFFSVIANCTWSESSSPFLLMIVTSTSDPCKMLAIACCANNQKLLFLSSDWGICFWPSIRKLYLSNLLSMFSCEKALKANHSVTTGSILK